MPDIVSRNRCLSAPGMSYLHRFSFKNDSSLSGINNCLTADNAMGYFFKRIIWPSLIAFCLSCPLQPAVVTGTNYYVSSSSGLDSHDGLSEATPWQSIEKVNTHSFLAGDNILFRCGDSWRGEMLIITDSGQPGLPITFTSYPNGCTNKPIISGSQTISGWRHHAGNIYFSDLDDGNNSGKFTNAINQLFKNETRLPMGRWPNPTEDDGGVHFHRGYSVIDGQPSATTISDSQLPSKNWTGGTAHIKGMRWYILNRDITGNNGNNLTLESEATCWGNSCENWGYFINNHLSTLDQEGEWYHDPQTNRVYLYTSQGNPPDTIYEGSVALTDDDRSWGCIVLGKDLEDHIKHVVIDNFKLIRGYRNGITTPTNLATHENSFLIIRNNIINDMDDTGIKLATWVWDAKDGGSNGWRGGNNLEIRNNHIERVNHFGIDTYSRYSLFQSNIIKDVGILSNLGESGLGCGKGSGGYCTEPGDGFRIKVDKKSDSGHHNTLIANRLENIAYNGVDIFGHNNILQNNYISNSCATKGDCGAIRTFGRANLSSTYVHDITLENNILLDISGNTDGAHPTYRNPFGFGLYIDNYSKNVHAVNNSIINASVHGILYQRSTGTITSNTLYNNVSGPSWGAQISIGSSPASVSSMHNNIMFGLQTRARTLSSAKGSLRDSNENYFFNPFSEPNIDVGGPKTLAEYQAATGMDTNSKKNWYSLETGDPLLSQVFINGTDTITDIDLGSQLYLDLNQNPVEATLSLPPFTSQVLILNGEIAPQLSHSIAILQIIAGTIPQKPVSTSACDLNGDGHLGLSDAIAILKEISSDSD